MQAQRVMRKGFCIVHAVFPAMVPVMLATGGVAARETVRLTFGIQSIGDPHGKLEMQLAQEYMKLHPEVQIDIIAVDWDKVAVQIAGGSPPDIFSIETKVAPQFAEAGLLADVDYLSAKYGPFDELDQLHPVIVDMHRWKGKLMVLPYRVYIYGMYLNTTLFDERGVPLPGDDWTWDDYLRIGQKISRDIDGDGTPDIWGVGHDTNLLSRLSPWVWQNGGDWWTADYSRALLDQPEVYEAIDWLANLRRLKVHPPQGVSPSSTFVAGKMGVYGPISNLFVGDLRDQRLPWSWEVATLPARVQRANLAGSRSWAIPINARYQKEAWDFAKFLTSWSSQMYRFKTLGMIGSNRRIAQLPEIRNPVDPPKRIRIFFETMAYSKPDPNHPNLLKIQTAILDAYREVWSGNKSARIAGQQLVPVVNELLKTR